MPPTSIVSKLAAANPSKIFKIGPKGIAVNRIRYKLAIARLEYYPVEFVVRSCSVSVLIGHKPVRYPTISEKFIGVFRMRMFLIMLITAVLFAPTLSSAVQADTLEQIEQSGKVRIGFRKAQPPMSFLDMDGKPAGYSVDLCVRIVNEVKNTLGNPNIAIEYVPVSSSYRFEALADNSIDILCGATTKTISRGKLVDFTQLTFVTGASLLSLKEDGIGGVSALQGKKVGVTKGTTTLDTLTAKLKESVSDAKVVPFDSTAAGMKALIKGEIDAFSADQVVLIGLVLTHQGEGQFAIATDIFSYEPFALAVKRNDSDFRLLADTVLSQLNRSGQITPIYSKWFGKFTKKIPTLLQAMYVLNSTPE